MKLEKRFHKKGNLRIVFGKRDPKIEQWAKDSGVTVQKLMHYGVPVEDPILGDSLESPCELIET